MATSWTVTTRPATDVLANQKWGNYDPNKYEYRWEGNYMNRYDKNPYTQVQPQLMQTEQQKQGTQYLSDALKNPQPVFSSTQGVANNQYTSQIQQQLNQYLNRTQPESVRMAEQELQNTLSGNYNPNDSQYYQGVRQEADINLADALNRYTQQQQLKGSLRSTATDAGRSRLLASNTANLNQILGQLALQERQNRLGAVNQAMAMGQYQSGEQANTLNQLTSTSDYLRNLEQQQKDWEYEEWKRQQQQPLSIAQFLASNPATYSYPQYQYTGAV